MVCVCVISEWKNLIRISDMIEKEEEKKTTNLSSDYLEKIYIEFLKIQMV